MSRSITIESSRTIDVPDYGTHLRIEQIVDLVKRSGSHFFDKETMKWFRSRVDAYAVAGRDGWYFVTSEQNKGWERTYPRLYTVRCLRLEGHDDKPGIEWYELGGFQAYPTLGRARTAAKHAAKVGAPVCGDCHLRLRREAEVERCGKCQERKDRYAREEQERAARVAAAESQSSQRPPDYVAREGRM